MISLIFECCGHFLVSTLLCYCQFQVLPLLSQEKRESDTPTSMLDDLSKLAGGLGHSTLSCQEACCRNRAKWRLGAFSSTEVQSVPVLSWVCASPSCLEPCEVANTQLLWAPGTFVSSLKWHLPSSLTRAHLDWNHSPAVVVYSIPCCVQWVHFFMEASGLPSFHCVSADLSFSQASSQESRRKCSLPPPFVC